MKKYVYSVSGKLLLAAGAAITVIVLAYTAVSGWRTSTKVNAQVMELATQKASWAAGQVGLQMTVASSTATALSAMIAGYIEAGGATKAGVKEMLGQVPLQYPNLYSAWMAGIPDGPTNTLLSGDDGNNEDGVFTPYWTKNANGGLDFSTFAIAQDQEYFAVPLSSGKSVATMPYSDTSGVMMTSLAVPVRSNGQIIGIAGVDITLNNMSTMMAQMETFDGGRMMLVDSAGNWVANPDSALLTKAYEETGKDDLQAALADGKPRVVRGFNDNTTRLIYPFTAPGMNRTWATILDVPAAVFSTPVRNEVIATIIGGLVILAMTLVTIVIASGRMVRQPLGDMLGAVNALADGSYDIVVPSADRRDEIGDMAKSVEALRQNLLEKSGLEAEQARLRDQAEVERERRLADEERSRQEREERRLQDQEREARTLAEREEMRQKDERERAERAAELAKVIDNLAVGLRGLASGNLDVAIDGQFPAVYDPLRLDFNNTVDHLTQLVSSISSATREIAGGTQEISRATTDLSRQTENTAATLEETAAALNELTASVKSAAQSSRHADGLVRETSKKADTTTTVVEETVTAMQAIQASSEKISKIIDVIDDIAFQTNLLALNAGVEAARAGEAGRGFAVVASEVRELAQRSSAAAREIDELISKSGVQVASGVTLVGRTGEALKSIMESIGVISSHVGDIASSADEQAAGISEINSAVSQLDRAQQESAATFEETSAACMALDGQAHDLQQLVGQFRMGQTGAGWATEHGRAA
ncbi:methyl-accepting chemotaxis protein [Phaeovulum sp. W22_SRMD_FR3]|uniref:methyl-accepting chemotaxis protein n=1 Tax=Phaeovulum sp. W22_SRMD_FR3 TaxID=3240274 RepID=UPI003F95C940